MWLNALDFPFNMIFLSLPNGLFIFLAAAAIIIIIIIICVYITGFQSPKAINCRRFTGFNYGDSPGDVEPSQDIIWDPTSPTAAATGNSGHAK